MALEHHSPHLGDIGDGDSEHEPDPDRVYEGKVETE
jgi:hypothetical protein